MTPVYERSAGVVPFRQTPGRTPLYLVIHSAFVKNPRARWEFPKGAIETGECSRETALRELREETGIVLSTIRDGFESSFSYTYVRDGHKRFKSVTFYAAEVFDCSTQARSHEHVEDSLGCWCHWGPVEEIAGRLFHSKIQQLLLDVDSWLRGTPSAGALKLASAAPVSVPTRRSLT